MSVSLRMISAITLLLAAAQVLAFDIKQGHILLEAGAFSVNQGEHQDIMALGIIGDRFRITDKSDANALFGLGYLVPGVERDKFVIDYGINAFYLARTRISGVIDQELVFTNLGYSFNTSNLPIYATAKTRIKTQSDRFDLTIDAGIGPNYVRTRDYYDWSLDAGFTNPDHAFIGKTSVVFSATAGIGIRMNNILGHMPLECGYRFFYLGEGQLNPRTDQIVNNLKTGNNYAQAFVCTATI